MDNKMILEMTRAYEPINMNRKLKGIVQKWSRTGLLKKLNTHKTQVVAQLLENQAVELRKSILSEASQASSIAGYSKIAFPLVRRAFGQLLASELVAIQPMSLPSGLLFFLDFKFDRTNGGATAGGSVYGRLANAPPNNNSQLSAVGDQTASGGFYNLITGYSKRMFILSSVAPTYSGVTATSELLGNVTVSGYNFTLASSGATDLGNLHMIRMAASGEINENATNTFRSLRALHSLTGSSAFGDMDHTLTILTGALVQVFLARPNANWPGPNIAWTDGSVTAAIIVGPARTTISSEGGTTTLGDFESTTAIPEVNIAVSSIPVMAGTRKLKATWTPELAQDINSYHGIDAEVELTTILSDIIATEVDREVLGQLLSGASVKAAWSRAIGRYVRWTTNNVVTTVVPNATYTYQAFFGTQQEWYQTLGETINVVSGEIHKRNMRSGANWIVTSPDIASIIESMSSFKPNATFDPSEIQYSLGIEKVGTISNRFTVYKDPYFPDYILTGYKGPGFLDSGFVYAPYVPLVFTPTIFHPDDFTPRKGAMTRYAMQMVRPEFYGVVVVVDLNTVGSPASI